MTFTKLTKLYTWVILLNVNYTSKNLLMKPTQFYEIDITPIVKQKTVSERLGV